MNDSVFLVLGLGTFGMETCLELSARGARVIAVDNRADLIEKIKDQVAQAVLLDSTDELQLSSLPMDDVDMAVIAIGDNIEANILTTALLKKAGVPYIIARAATELHHRVLKQVGANSILDIEKNAGRQLAEKILSPDILDSVPITMEISIAEIFLPAGFEGQSAAEVDLPGKMKLNISAIKRESISVDEEGNPVSHEHVVFPDAETVFEHGDILVVIGRNDDIEQLKGI
ncbi:MAG: TrkA family potassium uptake protein [Spirochaetales bacterium]|uniref:TrkA family potassium uptake protein n=1 Tax=Candidatus Thalassospirochaeta sargassi TaxID=3119039 RepID=A0AAJ1IEA9_9SPIO|nr:TrkA family potassium uptake protein [Spirochaetales bacterium]